MEEGEARAGPEGDVYSGTRGLSIGPGASTRGRSMGPESPSLDFYAPPSPTGDKFTVTSVHSSSDEKPTVEEVGMEEYLDIAPPDPKIYKQG